MVRRDEEKCSRGIKKEDKKQRGGVIVKTDLRRWKPMPSEAKKTNQNDIKVTPSE